MVFVNGGWCSGITMNGQTVKGVKHNYSICWAVINFHMHMNQTKNGLQTLPYFSVSADNPARVQMRAEFWAGAGVNSYFERSGVFTERWESSVNVGTTVGKNEYCARISPYSHPFYNAGNIDHRDTWMYYTNNSPANWYDTRWI